MTSDTTPFRRPLWWFFVAALGMSAVVAYDMALPVGVGAVLGYITERRVDWMFGRIKKPDNARWRAILSSAFIVLVLLVVFLPVGLAVYLALTDLLKLLGHLDWGELNEKLEHLGPVVAERLQKLGVDVTFDQIRGKAIELVTSKAGAAGGIVAGLLSATPNVLFNALIIVIGWYVFATEGKAAREEVLPKLIPWPQPRQILRETTSDVIESVIIANILVSAVQALCCAVPLIALRVPRALVWSLLAFFLSFIPIVGTVPITFGAALWCYSQGRTGGAIVMVVVGLFVGSVDNVLRPMFMRSSKSAELSTLWLLVALTSGVSAFGLAGVILGPLAFALFVAFTRALEPPAIVPATMTPAHVEDPSVQGGAASDLPPAPLVAALPPSDPPAPGAQAAPPRSERPAPGRPVVSTPHSPTLSSARRPASSPPPAAAPAPALDSGPTTAPDAAPVTSRPSVAGAPATARDSAAGHPTTARDAADEPPSSPAAPPTHRDTAVSGVAPHKPHATTLPATREPPAPARVGPAVLPVRVEVPDMADQDTASSPGAPAPKRG